MTSPIELSWGRITRWLASEAPESFARLNPRASDRAISEAENRLGQVFPPDLKTLLKLNDGVEESLGDNFKTGGPFLPGGHRLLRVDEMVERTAMLNEVLNDLDEEMVGRWWHPQWVCFAGHIAGDGLAIDLRLGASSDAVGEFMHEGFTQFDWGPSLAAVLGQIANCLEADTDFKYFRPVVENGCLDWNVILSDDQ
jgi:cell wall assembly regulator SMI1